MARVVEALVLLVVTLVVAVGTGIPTLWLLVPVVWISLTGRSYDHYGLRVGEIGSWKLHATLGTVIFGGYALVHYLFARAAFGARFEPTMNPDFLNLAVTHILIIGLSEEVFFRGYLQTELDDYFGRPWSLWGARIGWGLVAASVLFGLCHVIYGDLTRLRVAFFGLFAGWLRNRTGGVAVAALYHGIANVLYDFMQRSMV